MADLVAQMDLLDDPGADDSSSQEVEDRRGSSQMNRDRELLGLPASEERENRYVQTRDISEVLPILQVVRKEERPLKGGLRPPTFVQLTMEAEEVEAYIGALISFLSPLEAYPDFVTHEGVVNLLSSSFSVDPHSHSKYMERASVEASNVVQRLRQQLSQVDSDPYATRDAFENVSQFEAWKKERRQFLRSSIDSLCNSPVLASLHVAVIAGRDLLSKDPSGGCNPFCSLFLDTTPKASRNTRYVTPAIEGTTSPQWDAAFVLQEITSSTTSVTVDCWSKTKSKKKESPFLGEITVPFSELEKRKIITDWFELQKRTSKSHVAGELHLSFDLCIRRIDGLSESSSHRFSSRPLDYQSIYSTLLSKLLVYTVQNKGSSILNLESQSVKPYGEVGEWILRQFAQIYGIDASFCKLADFKEIFALARTDRTLVISLFDALNDVMHVKDWFVTERYQVERMFRELCLFVDDLLRKYRSFFPRNQPQGCIRAVVAMFNLLRPVWNLELSQIDEYLLHAAKRLYNSLVTDPFQLSSLHDGARALVGELHDDIQSYANTFPRKLNFAVKSGCVYFDLLWRDVRTALTNRESVQSGIQYVFGIHGFLRELRDIVIGQEQCEEERKRLETQFAVRFDESLFQPVVELWIKDARKRLRSWTVRACKADDWKPVPAALHGTSVIDTLQSCLEAFEPLRKVGEFVLEDQKDRYVEAVRSALEVYIETVVEISGTIQSSSSVAAARFAAESQKRPQQKIQMEHDPARKAEAVLRPPAAMEELCVMLNSVVEVGPGSQRVVEQVVSSSTRSISTMNTLPQHLEGPIRSGVAHIIPILVEGLNEAVLSFLHHIDDGRSVRDVFHMISTYLDVNLERMHALLSPALFQRTLRDLFAAFAVDLVDVLAPEGTGGHIPSERTCVSILDEADRLTDFFNADGEGVKRDVLENQLMVPRQIGALHDCPTEELIALYEELRLKQGNQLAGARVGLRFWHVGAILKGRATLRTPDSNAREYVAAHPGVGGADEPLRRLFNFPPNEVFLGKWNCCSVPSARPSEKVSTSNGSESVAVAVGGRMNRGALRLSTSHICFSSLVGRPFVYSLGDIQSMEKQRGHVMDNGLVLILWNGERIPFAGFVAMQSRDRAVLSVCEQARKRGMRVDGGGLQERRAVLHGVARAADAADGGVASGGVAVSEDSSTRHSRRRTFGGAVRGGGGAVVNRGKRFTLGALGGMGAIGGSSAGGTLVRPEAVQQTGWLQKQAAGVSRTWALRYFVLDDTALSYFHAAEDVESRPPSKRIALEGSGARAEACVVKGAKWTFVVTGGDSSSRMTLAATNERERDAWIAAIRKQLGKQRT